MLQSDYIISSVNQATYSTIESTASMHAVNNWLDLKGDCILIRIRIRIRKLYLFWTDSEFMFIVYFPFLYLFYYMFIFLISIDCCGCILFCSALSCCCHNAKIPIAEQWRYYILVLLFIQLCVTKQLGLDINLPSERQHYRLAFITLKLSLILEIKD